MATTTQAQPGTKPGTTLSKEEILRYSRHLIMPEVGMEGQLKLKNAKVLLIGTGGLGAPLGSLPERCVVPPPMETIGNFIEP